MGKYPIIVENEETGYSDWIRPKMKAYRMACCDCGLIHELDFKVIKQKKIIREYKDGTNISEFIDVENPKYQIVLRAKRNNRATAQHRRHKKDQASIISNSN